MNGLINNRPKEDNTPINENVTEENKMDAMRSDKIVSNDQENIPIAMI